MHRTLGAIIIICLVILTALVLWAGIGSVVTMDESSKSQGGQYYVGVAMVVALVWLLGQYLKLAKRFRR
jgi:uncharacterized protein YceK